MSRGQENIKQKQHCNKFSKDFKNGPHPKKNIKKKKELFPAFLLHLNPSVLPATPHSVLISFTKMLPLSGASSTSLLWSLLFILQGSTQYSLLPKILPDNWGAGPGGILSTFLVQTPAYLPSSSSWLCSISKSLQSKLTLLSPYNFSFLVHIPWGVGTTPQS